MAPKQADPSQLEQALWCCLQQAGLVAEPASDVLVATDCLPDLVARVSGRGVDRVIVGEVASSGQPLAVRNTANQLLRYVSALPGSYGVVVAPYVTPRGAAVCEEAGVGYVDLAGNCRLAFDSVYIRIEGNPNPYGERRDLRSLYSPRAERVLRALLASPHRPWRLQELATEARVSVGHAHNVKRFLREREWLAGGADGIRLSDPGALLAEWAAGYQPRRNRVREFYSADSLAEVEASLASACAERGARYALTGFSGAARLAPAVRGQRATAYVAECVDEVAEAAGLKQVSSGGNAVLLEPYDDGVFYGVQRVGDDEVASPVQCYLDLVGQRGRGEEAAATLLERVIRPSW